MDTIHETQNCRKCGLAICSNSVYGNSAKLLKISVRRGGVCDRIEVSGQKGLPTPRSDNMDIVRLFS